MDIHIPIHFHDKDAASWIQMWIIQDGELLENTAVEIAGPRPGSITTIYLC